MPLMRSNGGTSKRTTGLEYDRQGHHSAFDLHSRSSRGIACCQHLARPLQLVFRWQHGLMDDTDLPRVNTKLAAEAKPKRAPHILAQPLSVADFNRHPIHGARQSAQTRDDRYCKTKRCQLGLITFACEAGVGHEIDVSDGQPQYTGRGSERRQDGIAGRALDDRDRCDATELMMYTPERFGRFGL